MRERTRLWPHLPNERYFAEFSASAYEMYAKSAFISQQTGDADSMFW